MTLECGCPESWPDWHQQDIDLGGMLAHQLGLPCFLHMPLSYGLYAAKQHQQIQDLELTEKWPGLVLSTTGLLRGRIIRLLADQSSPSRHVSALPMDFRIRGLLHEGGIGTVRDSVRALQSGLLDQGHMPKELYMAYLTCPRCADQRGGDKILLARRWRESATLARKV